MDARPIRKIQPMIAIIKMENKTGNKLHGQIFRWEFGIRGIDGE